MRASQWLKTRRVNVVNQEGQPDGSLVVRIFVDGWSRAYSFRVRNLYQENEEILEDEDIDEHTA